MRRGGGNNKPPYACMSTLLKSRMKLFFRLANYDALSAKRFYFLGNLDSTDHSNGGANTRRLILQLNLKKYNVTSKISLAVSCIIGLSGSSYHEVDV